jgi:hypothetical protein
MQSVQLELYDVFVALRCIPFGETSFGDAAEYALQINAYPLEEASSPSEGSYVDMAGKHLPTLPVYDLGHLEKAAELLAREPLLERDKVMGGMLASIGIE